MEFGEQDTVRMCRQYREALRRQRDEPYTLLSERLARLERAVQFVATLRSMRRLTADEIAQLLAIATGEDCRGPVPGLDPRSQVSADRHVAPFGDRSVSHTR